MIRVKICGMASVDDVSTCVAAGADALGFIFAESPRKLTPGFAAALTAAVPPFVTTVGVFANNDADTISEAIAACRLDVLQFSGDEPPEFCGAFRKPTIVVARDREWSPVRLATARAVAVLVDAWAPDRYGGTGKTVDAADFARARDASPGASVILAGGLTPLNVAHRIRAVRPDAVDARTGVERAGRKDPELARAFVAAARDAL